MNENDLYEKYDFNDEPIYYTDSACTILYTGHVEDYDRDGSICMEADVVDGQKKGIYKQYYFENKSLELISYYEHNVGYGLEIEFFENGMVRSVSIVICNDYVDAYWFDEEGRLIEKEIWPNSKFWFNEQRGDEKTIHDMRERFNLEAICEDILKNGKDFDYRKYF